jgi:N-acetyl-anhydromuramyl-L-alanine amidase AmpD
MRSTLGVACLVVGCSVEHGAATAPRVALGGDSPLVAAFERVGADTGIAPATLAAASWTRARFRFATPAGGEAGDAVGLLAIPERDVARAAQLAGVTEAAARTDVDASLRAGAALLGEFPMAAIDSALARGIDGRDAAGNSIVVAAQPDVVDGLGSIAQGVNYPGATWMPASTSNYDVASRGVGDIDHIVIHDTEGNFDGTVSWFQDPAAQVSAHYVVRSHDGFVAQMVAEKNVAWHDKCFNTNTVGIEHEGYQAHPELWYTEAMYVASATLTAYLADKYGIAKEHGPILGHGEAPDCSDHTDPGPGWNWDHYIELVQSGGASQFLAGDLEVDAPATIQSGALATITVALANHGTSAWDLDATRVGTQDPTDRESAFFVDGDWIAPNRATAIDATAAPDTVGTFTFQIRGPDVAMPTVYDEAFQLVEGDATWFGPTFHVVIQVVPADPAPPMDSGCSAGGGAGAGVALVLLGLVRRRRRESMLRACG